MARILNQFQKILITGIVVKILTCLLILDNTFAWNINSETCNDLQESELLFLSNCNVTIDDEKYLYASCNLFCEVAGHIPFVGNTLSAIIVNWGVKSDKPIKYFNETICLGLSNITIEKVQNLNEAKPTGIYFTLLSFIGNELSEIEEGKAEIIFHKRRIVAIANSHPNCNVPTPNFELSAVDEKKNTSCKILVQGIKQMLLSAKWFSNISITTKEAGVQVMKKMNEVYFLDKTTIPLVRAKLKHVRNLPLIISYIRHYNVQRLELPKTNSRILNKDFFDISSLQILNLTNGIMEVAEIGILEDCLDLRIVDLSYNRFSTIPKLFYTTRNNLTYLNMEGNRPQKGTFTLYPEEQSSPLSVLRLSKILTIDLKPRSFASFPHLTALYLDQCKLTSIPDDTFYSLSSLLTLDFSRNQIAELPENIFFPLNSLKYLNMSRNRLTQINLKVLHLLQNLTVLNLQDNFITTFIFFSHPTLQFINLGNNRVKDWSVYDSTDTSILYDLDLSSNLISKINKSMQTAFKGNYIYLANNPFNCSPCNLHLLHVWFSNFDAVDPNEYICSSPAKRRGDSLFTYTSNEEDCLERTTNMLQVTLIISFLLSFIMALGMVAYLYRWRIRYVCFLLKSLVWSYKTEKESLFYEYDAYISYCSPQKRWIADYLVPQLESEELQLKLYIHDRNQRGGEDISETIETVIPKCRKVILLLSNDFIRNVWCDITTYLSAMNMFEESRDCLILVKMEEIQESVVCKHLLYLMKTRTFLKWPSKEEARPLFWERLRLAIRRNKNPDMLLKPLI